MNKIPSNLNPSPAIMQWYNVELQRMLLSMRKDIDSKLVPLVKSEIKRLNSGTANDSVDKILSMLNKMREMFRRSFFAEKLATTFIKKNSKYTADKFAVNIFTDDPDLENVMKLATAENVSKIKSIHSQYLDNVEYVINANFKKGARSGDLTKELSKKYGISKRRAKFIARDQTAKVNSRIASERAQNAGFEYFKWITSKDTRVRDRHRSIANRVTAYGKGVYRYDNPPLSDDGKPILPGEDYGCRCTAKPISKQQVMRNQKKGDVDNKRKR